MPGSWKETRRFYHSKINSNNDSNKSYTDQNKRKQNQIKIAVLFIIGSFSKWTIKSRLNQHLNQINYSRCQMQMWWIWITGSNKTIFSKIEKVPGQEAKNVSTSFSFSKWKFNQKCRQKIQYWIFFSWKAFGLIYLLSCVLMRMICRNKSQKQIWHQCFQKKILNKAWQMQLNVKQKHQLHKKADYIVICSKFFNYIWTLRISVLKT